jgi:hypothetical protein
MLARQALCHLNHSTSPPAPFKKKYLWLNVCLAMQEALGSIHNIGEKTKTKQPKKTNTKLLCYHVI